MNLSIRDLLSFFLQLGPLGILLVSIADDSFLFLPIGSDLLTVILVARHPGKFLLYVLAGAVGSTAGVLLLDIVCRKGGGAMLKRLVKPKVLGFLKRRMKHHLPMVVIITCLAPPPFPFGAAIAAASGLQYPRRRLLGLVFIARAVRYSLIGSLALYFGQRILSIANSAEFLWVTGVFIAFCAIGSVLSVIRWVRIGRAQ